ncbi:MAG: NACHT domain-containing protein, partial [Calditrichaeota bacterium]
HLNKVVFPEFRKLCRERGVACTEVDLQWGITEDQAREGGAIGICLDEVVRCRPHFIGLLGERYGWCPTDDNPVESILANPLIPEHTKEKLKKWCDEGKSATEMEILLGVLEEPERAPYSFFYFRDLALTRELAEGEDDPSVFFDGKEKKQRLQALKKTLRDLLDKSHVREEYSSIEEFGEQVLEDLKHTLDERFPAVAEESPLEAERRAHRAFACSRLSVNTAKGSSYIEDEDLWEAVFRDLLESGAVVLSGEMGLGKSAFMANAARQWRERHPKDKVIEHYVGVGKVATICGLLSRILEELRDMFPEVYTEDIPGESEIKAKFADFLLHVPSNRRVLLVLDAVNQLQEDESDIGRLVHLFPESTGAVRLLVSTQPGAFVDAADERGWKVHELKPLDEDGRKRLI